MLTEDTYNIDDVVVAALPTGITEIISKTRRMLNIVVFFFMISPVFTGKERKHYAHFIANSRFLCQTFPIGCILHDDASRATYIRIMGIGELLTNNRINNTREFTILKNAIPPREDLVISSRIFLFKQGIFLFMRIYTKRVVRQTEIPSKDPFPPTYLLSITAMSCTQRYTSHLQGSKREENPHIFLIPHHPPLP